MLDVSAATAKSLVLKFNGKKSHCLSLNKFANVDIGPMLLDNELIAWWQFIKYFVIHLLSGKVLSLTLHLLKGPFALHVILFFSFSWC